MRRARGDTGTTALLPREASFQNPFKLMSAIKFALVFATILLASKLVAQYAPGGGLYWLSAIAGSTDVDALVLSVSEIGRNDSTMNSVLVRSILIAAVANTIFKFGLAAFLGTRALMRSLLPAMVAMSAVGLVLIALVG
jgi:uncharacterized membrane protein (DUF4010 family)